MEEKAFSNLLIIFNRFAKFHLNGDKFVIELMANLQKDPNIGEDELPEEYNELYEKVKDKMRFNEFINCFSVLKERFSNLDYISDLDILKIIVTIVNKDIYDKNSFDFLTLPEDLLMGYDVTTKKVSLIEFLVIYSFIREIFEGRLDNISESDELEIVMSALEYVDDGEFNSVLLDEITDEMMDDYEDFMDYPVWEPDGFEGNNYEPMNEDEYLCQWDESIGNPRSNPVSYEINDRDYYDSPENFEINEFGSNRYVVDVVAIRGAYSFLKDIKLSSRFYHSFDNIILELDDFKGMYDFIDYFVNDYKNHPNDYSNAEEVLEYIEFFYKNINKGGI